LKDSKEDLYWENDDVNPNQIIYDLENNKKIIPNSEDEITDSPYLENMEVKSKVKNVRNSRNRNNK
jgi:hypothetical protein